MALTLSSAAFSDMESIPEEYTCDGANISPPLAWEGVPHGSRSLVLTCEDLDTPIGSWSHWVCYDMPTSVTKLKEAIPVTDLIQSGGKQGINDFSKVGYGGPCPPNGMHQYIFRLYALDCLLNCQSGKSQKEIEYLMSGHIIEDARLTGTYTRK